MKRIADFLRRVWKRIKQWIKPGNLGPLPPFKLAPASARAFNRFQWQHMNKAARRRRIAKARRLHP